MEQLKIHNLNKNKTLGEILEVNGVSIEKFESYWKISNELIGNGYHGKVFDIGNNKILKISDDKNEYDAMHVLNDEINDENDWFKHFVNLPLLICPVNESFHDSSDDSNQKNIRYYFIYEKLYKLTQVEENCIYSILDIFNAGRIEDIVIEYEEDIGDYYDQAIEVTQEYVDEVNVRELIFFIFNSHTLSEEHSLYDLHIDNIMKNIDGNYKLIDLRV